MSVSQAGELRVLRVVSAIDCGHVVNPRTVARAAHETLGVDWLTPDLYRFGASSLLNDIMMQLRKEKTGRYQSPDYFTID